MKKFEYKVPGGKLLRAKAEAESGRIKFLQFTGDFFLTPVGDLEELEVRLTGEKAEAESLKRIIEEFFSAKKTVLSGASPADFAYVLAQALK